MRKFIASAVAMKSLTIGSVLVSSLIAVGVLAATSASSTRATGHVSLYWTDEQDNSIGRANLDGTHVKKIVHVGLGPAACTLAIAGGYAYWGSDNGFSIGRISLTGGHPNPNFISGVGGSCGVTIAGKYIYWDNGSDSIGRANLDGSGVNHQFIGTPAPTGVAVAAGHIYWGHVLGSGVTKTISRANLDGTGVIENFIPSAINAWCCATDSKHIYWGNGGPKLTGTSIGRANLDGTGVNEHFVKSPGVTMVAVDSGHVYWTTGLGGGFSGSGAIGRANLDGTHINPKFIHIAGDPWGITIAP
jgi:hypothetical protein